MTRSHNRYSLAVLTWIICLVPLAAAGGEDPAEPAAIVPDCVFVPTPYDRESARGAKPSKTFLPSWTRRDGMSSSL